MSGVDEQDGEVQLAALHSALADALVKVENLNRALISSRVIGAAIGIIMSQCKITYDAAFGVLSEASQNRNLKLHDLAERVILTGNV